MYTHQHICKPVCLCTVSSCLSACTSVPPACTFYICPFTPSTYLLVCLSVCLPFCYVYPPVPVCFPPRTYLPVCLPAYLIVCLTGVRLPACSCLPARLPDCLPLCCTFTRLFLSASLLDHICLSVCPPAGLSASRLFVYLPVPVCFPAFHLSACLPARLPVCLPLCCT
jgi:hypothetical protein